MKIRKVFALCLSLVMVFGALLAAVPQAEAAEVVPVQTQMYGRQALSALSNSKALLYAYDQLAQGVENSLAEISVYNGVNPITMDEVKMVMDAYGRDYTYHFWLGNQYSVSYNSTTVTKLIPKYIFSGAALETAKASFNAAAEEILSGLRSGMSEYEKELYIHDALVKRVEYVSASNAHNAYGALVEGLAVCEGYAEAFQYLLQRAGIQSFIIEGASRPPAGGVPIAHAWNAVKIGGKFYQVDITWDDQGDDIYHSYFNITDAMILEDHSITATTFAQPVCGSTDAFYFQVEGGYLTDYNANTIGSLLKANKGTVHVYVAGNVDSFCNWYMSNIMDIAHAAGIYDGFSYSYSYLGREVILQIPQLNQGGGEHVHDYREERQEPGCLTQGYVYYTCDCGDAYGEELPPVGHKMSEAVMENIVEPTCTEEGSYELAYYCSRCGIEMDREQNTIFKKDHDFKTSVTKPTCTEDGYTTYTCSRCDKVGKGNIVPAVGHTPNIPEPTATKDQVCTTCGQILAPKLDHSCQGNGTFVPAKAATCTENGNIAHYRCSCGKLYEDQQAQRPIADPNSVILAAAGHKEKTLPGKTPTCIATGLTEGIECTVCGAVLQAQTVLPQTAHDYQELFLDPTCTLEGVYYAECTICGDYILEETGPALGHTYSNADDEECNVCGGYRFVKDAEYPFTANEWEMLKLVNKARVNNGLQPLTGSAELQRAGHIRAKELNNYYGHERPSGDSCFTVLDELGISYYSAGENIAMGFTSPKDVTNAWLNSSGHYANIMSTDFAHVTMGNENYSWVQMFISGTKYTGITVLVPGDLTVEPGTTIDQLDLVAVLSTTTRSDLYLPVTAQYCTGYDPNGTGDQQVTINVLGVSGTFTLRSTVQAHVCRDNLTYVPMKDSTCTDFGNLAHYLCTCGITYADAQANSILSCVPILPLGHEEKTLAGYAPTCLEPGKTEGKICNRCSQVLQEQESIAALGHDMVTDQEVAPTCDSDGYTQGSHCGRCMAILQEQQAIPALGHIEQILPAVEATCAGYGMTEGKKCSRCGEILLAQQMTPMLEHTPVKDPDIPPTCTTEGLTGAVYCGVCRMSLEDHQKIPMIPHTEQILPGKASTCTEQGRTEGSQCADCGKILVQPLPLPVLDHDAVVLEAVAPTCTQSGLTQGEICSRCGTTLVAQQRIDPLGHEEKTLAGKAATCTQTGLTEGKICGSCGAVLAEQTVIPVTGHLWSNGICGSCGLVCGHETTDEDGRCTICGSGCAHDYLEAEAAPTCTEQGYTIHTCRLCGYEYKDNFISALGHDWKAATCEAPRTCRLCALTEGEALGHNYVSQVVAPTCTTQGFTSHTCSVCGKSYDDAHVSALGHVEGASVKENSVAATCGGEGSYETVLYCTVCSQELSRQKHTVPALPHSYRDTVTASTCTDQGYTTHTCENCGHQETDSYTPATDHSYGDWTVTQEPGCTTWGKRRRDCENCSIYMIQTTKPLDHDWNGDTCRRCGESRSTFKVELSLADSENVESVFVDGKEYPVTQIPGGIRVELPDSSATNLVIYSWNDPEAADVHTQYPTGMRVWLLRHGEEGYTAEYVQGFDNLLQYSGSSIRVSGVKGIRMITSVNKSTRTKLMSTGISGWKLVEYGTVLAWNGSLDANKPLVLGKDYVKSNYAYRRGEADPIFRDAGDLIQYTNVLVNFGDSQCAGDLAMRPYMILENNQGQQITLYGGTVVRSIGYVAYQNRDAFPAGSEAYEYVWKIIRNVYGDRYDGEYKG